MFSFCSVWLDSLSRLNFAVSCIFDPLPSALKLSINPPEPRWPDATVHRIAHSLHCIIIIDWSVSLSVYDPEIFTHINHSRSLSLSHNASGVYQYYFFLSFFFPSPRQHEAFEYTMTWIYTLGSNIHSGCVTYLLKVQLKKSCWCAGWKEATPPTCRDHCLTSRSRLTAERGKKSLHF